MSTAADRYIRTLALELTREEDLTDDEARSILLDLALRIRALLATLPDGALAREIIYSRIRPRLTSITQSATQQIFGLFRTRLPRIEATSLSAGARLFATDAAPPPRSLPTLLQETRIQAQSLLTLFTPSPITGVSPFTAQLLRLIDRSVRAAFFRATPTAEMLQQLVPTRVRAGRPTPIPAKGTLLSSWRSRLKALTAAAFWTIAFSAQQRASATASLPISGWRWEAILDPKTCPICRPLDGQIRPTPTAFPQGPPPLHPLCRCVLVPLSSD